MALNAIATPNAIARTLGYDAAVAGRIAISPATGRPLPVVTELAMPLAVLVTVDVVASTFVVPLISMLSDRTRTLLDRRTPWMVSGGLLCTLIALVLGQNIDIIMFCIFRVFL